MGQYHDNEVTYDDINGFVQIDHDAFFVYNWNCRDSTFGKHMDDIENTGGESSSSDRIEAFGWVREIPRDIGPDFEFTKG
jgi:hypothetical protein